MNEKYGYIMASSITPDMIWNFVDQTNNHTAPGQYTKANGWTGYFITNADPTGTGGSVSGEVGSYPIQKGSQTTLTADLYSYTTLLTASRLNGIWYNTPIDPKTGETSLFCYTNSGARTNVIRGTSDGFVSVGGTGTLDSYAALSRVKVYELVN